MLQRVQTTADFTLSFPKLDPISLLLDVYADASFANRSDRSSYNDFIICLADRPGALSVLAFRSKSFWRVFKSNMAAETLASAASFDAVYLHRRQLEIIHGQPLPLLMLTDNKGLFDFLTSHKLTKEARLLTDISSVRH